MKTIAEMLARHYGKDNGSLWTDDMRQVCYALAVASTRSGGNRRWEFRDGSGIVLDLHNGIWDVEGAEPFSWRGK